jgi:putative redox protein
VEAAFTMSADRPARVDTITLRLLVPGPLEPNRRRALLAVVDHCTVHNSIRTPPEVRVTLGESAGTGPAPLATVGG